MYYYISYIIITQDRRLPKIRVRTKQASRLLGQRVIVMIDSWAKTSKFPNGHFVRSIGQVGDRLTETQVLLLEHDVSFTPFSKSVLSSLPVEGEGWVVSDSHLAGRMDLRHLDVCRYLFF